MSWISTILIENKLINTAFASSFIGLIIYWVNLIVINSDRMSKMAQLSTIITNISLSIVLLLRWIINNYFPLSNLYESLIFLTWSFTFIQLILEYQNKSKLIGSINMPICLFTIAFASFSLPPEMKMASPLVPALRSNWLMMHVSIMMISYATLILGSLLSILFLILAQNQKIELQGNSYNKSTLPIQYNISNAKSYSNIKQLQRIDLLQKIDNLSYRIIGFGFPLLTIGIIAGAVWANEAWGTYWSWDPKETWALITWIIFAAYLHSRLNQSWQGKKPAILASIGFVIVWICYLGVNFLGKGLHSYGWLS